MTNITAEAQDFFKTIEGSAAVMPDTAGIEYLDIDVVDFTDQGVSNLYGDKYIILYIIKDLNPKTDDELRDSYYERSIGSTIFYPDDVKSKLVSHFGELSWYMHNDSGMFISTFDYDAIDDDAERIKFSLHNEKTTDYAASTPKAREKMWEPLSQDEIDRAITHAKEMVDPNLPTLFMMETSTNRPYSVSAFNNTVSSFIRSFSSYEECKDLVERIHTNKIKVITNEMAYV